MNVTGEEKSGGGEVVTVATRLKSVHGQNIHFIFTPSQVEEVLPDDLTSWPVPFAPSFLRGLSFWRGQVVPVVDVEMVLDSSGGVETVKECFFVVRSGMPKNYDYGEQKLVRWIMPVSGEIHTRDITEFVPIVDFVRIGIESLFVRGVYELNREVYIVPDVLSILQNPDHL